MLDAQGGSRKPCDPLPLRHNHHLGRDQRVYLSSGRSKWHVGPTISSEEKTYVTEKNRSSCLDWGCGSRNIGTDDKITGFWIWVLRENKREAVKMGDFDE
ncbi:hypothetical protein V6N13_087810 [Hibiscus sabdariffa]